MLPSQISSGPQYVGIGGFHVVGGGTSAASPVVAGIAALYLQRYPTASWSDVRNAIVNCSRQDAFTGSNLPNVTWGNGKVDAFSALVGCPATAAQHEAETNVLSVFPNPAEDQFTVNFSGLNGKAELLLYDAQGRTVRRIALTEGQEELKLSCRGLAPGLYLCAISENGHVAGSRRIVVQ
jgi:subtilisin family serine protease